MSISDLIVVMKEGVVQQIGRPQEVYDNPGNLFVAKFLGTPPINVFEGRVREKKLYIGDDAVLNLEGAADRQVYVGIRPEGFLLQDDGPFCCELRGLEVMGRDISVLSAHGASLNPTIRSIVAAENQINPDRAYAEKGNAGDKTYVRFALKPRKVYLFDRDTEERVEFEAADGAIS